MQLLMTLLMEFYSLVAIRYFYLTLFDLMIGTLLDVIFSNITHVNVDTNAKGHLFITLLNELNLTAYGKIDTTHGQ